MKRRTVIAALNSVSPTPTRPRTPVVSPLPPPLQRTARQPSVRRHPRQPHRLPRPRRMSVRRARVPCRYRGGGQSGHLAPSGETQPSPTAPGDLRVSLIMTQVQKKILPLLPQPHRAFDLPPHPSSFFLFF